MTLVILLNAARAIPKSASDQPRSLRISQLVPQSMSCHEKVVVAVNLKLLDRIWCWHRDKGVSCDSKSGCALES